VTIHFPSYNLRLGKMLIIKRLLVWLLERFVEAFLLGGLLAYLVLPKFTFIRIWVWPIIVATVLFTNGYYVTTAFFGVVWRSAKRWLYPAITAALFMVHAHIVFLRGKPDFTPEARAMELPFLLGGVCIVFACAFAGGRVLNKWVEAGTSMNAYLSATGITLLVFLLANIAHFLRPVVGDSAFRPDGVPFTFYREGSFVDGWVWHGAEFLWHGMVADAALATGTIVLLGKAWVEATRSR
jgi:hypothetical protein